MQSNSTCKIGCSFEQRMVPSLTHATGIDKQERGFAFTDDRDHLIDQFQSKVPGPRIFFYLIRNDGMDVYLLFQFCGDDDTWFIYRIEQHFLCLFKITD